jgi:hypothetical protein
MIEIADEPLKDNVEAAHARNRIDVRKFAVARFAPNASKPRGSALFTATNRAVIFWNEDAPLLRRVGFFRVL